MLRTREITARDARCLLLQQCAENMKTRWFLGRWCARQRKKENLRKCTDLLEKSEEYLDTFPEVLVKKSIGAFASAV